MNGPSIGRAAAAVRPSVVVAAALVLACAAAYAVDEPPVPFGRVIYRAAKVGSFERLGVAVIACRHRDSGPRSFAVEFFDLDAGGKRVSMFGPNSARDVPRGRKVVFVSDRSHFANRDIVNMNVAHLSRGTARVVSDARVVHCSGKMRFDPGKRAATYWREIGLVREGRAPSPGRDPW